MPSAVDWHIKVRDKFRAKFKIPHSYDHLVATSGQCDASITECLLILSFHEKNWCMLCLNKTKITN